MRTFAYDLKKYQQVKTSLSFTDVRESVKEIFPGVKGNNAGKIINIVSGLMIKYHNTHTIAGETKMIKRTEYYNKVFKK